MKSAEVLGCAAAVAVGVAGSASAADLRACEIDRISGDDVVLTTPSESFSADVGQSIPSAATLATGPDSRVVVRCDDGTTITLGPDTRIVLDDLVGEAGPDRNVFLRLVDGITGIVAPNRTWNRFEVETSVAIASVRSTEWLVESRTGTGTAVFVALGSVDVRANEQAYVLARGEGITVQDELTRGLESEAPEVKLWGEERIARSRTALGFDWQ